MKLRLSRDNVYRDALQIFWVSIPRDGLDECPLIREFEDADFENLDQLMEDLEERITAH